MWQQITYPFINFNRITLWKFITKKKHTRGPFTNMDSLKPSLDKYLLSTIKYGIKLLMHSEISTVQVFKCEWINNFMPHCAFDYLFITTKPIIGSVNGLSPNRPQAIIWTNAVLLSVGHSGTNFWQIIFKSQTFSLRKMHLKMSSGKCRPFGLGLNLLN